MIIIKRFLVIAVWASALVNVRAQSNDNYNMWFQYLMNAKLSDKYTLTLLSQYRSFDLGLDTRLFLVNGYIDYEITENTKLGGGYMFLTLNSYQENNSKKTRYENRSFQQLTLNGHIGRTSIVHRFRVEERFLTNPADFILRLRYLISARIPLYKKGEHEKLYAILKNEIRMNAKKEDSFHSNRITVGLGIKLNNLSAMELAFINQLSPGRTNSYVYIGYRNNFDWRKK
ncbi:DUF2490 domain-containing protein [Elizabethkingia anophelis]|uniref:DUF2490 domain-containing protein n=1 Tax=Elizabethkingia anophelis TaxID=1117645 RepID=A0AAU8VH08_9FLAO|nr:DUF2490 domain-containing protein [Elizabethkingia anophelis]AQX02191.1 hypothetical protein BBD32_12295 [Elizabethkingia anophelis]OPB60942.1 hypothetical protein BAY11_17710 [Elizabethkingia anophelis]